MSPHQFNGMSYSCTWNFSFEQSCVQWLVSLIAVSSSMTSTLVADADKVPQYIKVLEGLVSTSEWPRHEAKSSPYLILNYENQGSKISSLKWKAEIPRNSSSSFLEKDEEKGKFPRLVSFSTSEKFYQRSRPRPRQMTPLINRGSCWRQRRGCSSWQMKRLLNSLFYLEKYASWRLVCFILPVVID